MHQRIREHVSYQAIWDCTENTARDCSRLQNFDVVRHPHSVHGCHMNVNSMPFSLHSQNFVIEKFEFYPFCNRFLSPVSSSSDFVAVIPPTGAAEYKASARKTAHCKHAREKACSFSSFHCKFLNSFLIQTLACGSDEKAQVGRDTRLFSCDEGIFLPLTECCSDDSERDSSLHGIHIIKDSFWNPKSVFLRSTFISRLVKDELWYLCEENLTKNGRCILSIGQGSACLRLRVSFKYSADNKKLACQARKIAVLCFVFYFQCPSMKDTTMTKIMKSTKKALSSTAAIWRHSATDVIWA